MSIGGNVEAVHARAATPADLEAALLAFKGVGPVTLSIFLRELRGVWDKADPPLTKVEVLAATRLGLTRSRRPSHALAELEELWSTHSVPGYDFRHLLGARRSGAAQTATRTVSQALPHTE